MMNERDRFWILQGGRDWDYELLVYDDHRVVVPRNGRYALLQAAHAASHQGLGRMRDLLEKSFYWPRMTLDAQRYAQVCLAARRKGIAPPLAHCQPQPRKVQTSPHGDGELRGENVQADHRSNATHEDRRGPGGQEVSNGQGDELAPGPKTRTRRRRRSRASRQGPYRQRLPHSQCLTQQLNGLRRGMLHLKM